MHPEKIDSLVMLAPVYMRGTPPAPAPSPAVGITTRDGFEANWDSQIGCRDQYDPSIRDSLWSQLLQSDPTGASWGPGLYRWPTGGGAGPTITQLSQGWGTLAVQIQAPTLLISGETDKLVLPQNVRDLYADLKMSHKAFAALPCSSHYAPWETRHTALFQASAEWLLHGTVNGEAGGTFRLRD
jgi:pimeloyl-ACP methyl ester carboxylesterase